MSMSELERINRPIQRLTDSCHSLIVKAKTIKPFAGWILLVGQGGKFGRRGGQTHNFLGQDQVGRCLLQREQQQGSDKNPHDDINNDNNPIMESSSLEPITPNGVPY